MCQLFHCLQWYAGSERVKVAVLYSLILGCLWCWCGILYTSNCTISILTFLFLMFIFWMFLFLTFIFITFHFFNVSFYDVLFVRYEPPAIPYLGMYLSDLSFIEEGNKQYHRRWLGQLFENANGEDKDWPLNDQWITNKWPINNHWLTNEWPHWM